MERLRGIPQWILWKEKKTNDNKTTKVPIGANGRAVSITNPKCFRTFENAINTFLKNNDIFDGIGFIFTEDDPFVGIDLDNVNKWYGWEEIIQKFDSYTEMSPSGTGYHIITEGFIPGNNTHGIKIGSHETGGIELYDSKRYLTITIDILNEYKEIKPNQNAIEWLVKSIDDKSLINKILTTDYRDKFIQLWEGKVTGYVSHSEADLAFCRILSNNHAPMHQIDRLLRKSKLYRPKWHEKRGNTTYGLMTLEKATDDQNF